VSYDSLVTLKDIELKVKKGEFVCIIGDVGSGKSSILSTVIGDLIPINERRDSIIRKNMDRELIDERCAEQM
jgi:ABC-type nitrate/sulfonate/bicarbonate transport system ATPase subunit